MHEQVPPKLQIAINSLLTKPAVCSPELRQAVANYAGQIDEKAGISSPIPPEVCSFVEKIALRAYQVTDQDIERLKAAGYSEDAIFELTLSAAVGASLARLECGLAALEGAR